MKILIVTQYFWPEIFRINELAFTLAKRGHEVTVLTGTPNYPEGKFFTGFGCFKRNTEVFKRVRIHRIPIVPRGKNNKIQLFLNYLSFVVSGSILGPFKCRSKFDVIFVYEPSPITVGLPAIVFKFIKKAPLLFWVQDLWPETLSAVDVVRSKTILNIIGWLVAFIYYHCDRILIQSEGFRTSLSQYKIENEKILYFPNSAEELYRPIAKKADDKEKELLPYGFRIMFAGNVGAAQDFPTILKAANKLKEYEDIHWVILGDGRMKPWVEGQIDKLELKKTVHLLGKYPVESMPKFFSHADVLLATLKSEPIFDLTIPAKIQSYLACGKPIIAGIGGECARIVNESGAGISSIPENPEDLAEAVLKIYRLPFEKRQQMGQAGRDYFEKHFDGKILVKRLESWMINLLN
jgi:colanic acid biosynthesis glycosyl transferase WcaI